MCLCYSTGRVKNYGAWRTKSWFSPLLKGRNVRVRRNAGLDRRCLFSQRSVAGAARDSQDKKREEQAKDPELARNKRAFEIDKINLKRLSDAGVRIALGTDSGGAPTVSSSRAFSSTARWN
jgi:hypothetical protein